MKVIENENTIFFDIDQTLILHKFSESGTPKNNYNGLYVEIYDERIDRTITAEPYYPHIDILLQSKARGRFVVVWSASGHHWAELVMKALKLESHVDLVLTKPSAYVDDVDANKFMNRVYIDPKKES
jgi:FMN phosphatase YigB (HAD superfamily)